MNLRKPIWISHRGYCESATENTIEAFEAAIGVGFRAFETDLRITADNHIVLSHDRDLMRTAGVNVNVHQKTKKELVQIPLRRGSRLMFFEDLLLRFLNYRWTLEFKDDDADLCIERFLQIIEAEGLRDWVRKNVKFLVWKREHEERIQTSIPEAHFYALFTDCRKAALSRLFHLPFWKKIDDQKTYGVPPRFLGINLFQKKYVEAFHDRGAEILAYLPETEAESQAAVAAGFDEILTNYKISDRFT